MACLEGVITMSWGMTNGTTVDQAYLRDLIEAALGGGKPAQSATYIIFYDEDDKEYKARNGTTGKIDYSGTNASAVIQIALDGLTSGRTWKEKVVLKDDFEISDTLKIPSYTILEIQGALNLADGTNKDLIQNSDPSTGNTQIEIVGGVLYGNYGNQTASNGIYLRKVSKSYFKDVYVYDFKDRGWLIETCTENTFFNCWAVTCARSSDTDGFLLNINADDNLFVECVATYNKQAGFTIASGNKNIFICCRADHNGDAAVGARLDGFIVNGWGHKIIGCESNSNVADGLASYTATPSMRESHILGCRFADNGAQGIAIGNGTDLIIVDNLISGNQQRGILFGGTNDHIQISGNIIKNNGLEVADTYDGISLEGTANTYFSIKNNIIYDDQGTKTQRYGINEYRGNYNFIAENDLRENSLGGFTRDTGQGANTIIKLNLGYVTENNGSSTGTGSEQTIAHGLAGDLIPNHVSVIPTETGATVSGVWGDATNIYCTVTSGKAYKWSASVI